MGAGLGGGSSDAAFTLIALNENTPSVMPTTIEEQTPLGSVANGNQTTEIALGESSPSPQGNLVTSPEGTSLSVTPHGRVVTGNQTTDLALGESTPSPHGNVTAVKERTSTRLIANNNPPKQPQTKTIPNKNTPTDNDSPALAFFQNTGTSTSIDLKFWDL